MRIAIIGTRGPAGPARDGIDKALSEICPRLVSRGHEIDVFSERNGRSFTAIEGARLLKMPKLPVALGDASSHVVLSSLISACRGYDVINFFAAEASGLYSLAAKLGLHRTVVSMHGNDGPVMAGRGPESMAARFADAITVSSRRLERLFRETYGREAIYIPNGVERPRRAADTALLEPFELEPNSYVLFADRLVPETGAHIAIAAANAVAVSHRLVIAETGQGDDEYRRQLRQGTDPRRVLFAGQVGTPLLEALMGHAYLYLLPSQADEAPETLLASLAHGRAVVVSDVPEHLDVVAGDGFTFTAGDVADLKRVLGWLLADPEVVTRMRIRASATVANRFCWDRIADAYEQVYKAIL
ncbi:MAG: glycosyltransferase family 4 protein [Rhodospirillaceae bacterium]|nr:glycosyltransferase family 4 protein [Rhodospirillales bacterium]